MRRVVRLGVATVSLTAAMLACGDDDDHYPAPGDAGRTDTSIDAVDASASPDAPTGDADAGVPDASTEAEAGPTTTVTLGAAGRIRVFPDAVFAQFLEDQTILHTSNAPECVAHVWSKTKLFTMAGALTIGGEIVGSPGGPQANIVIQPGPLNETGYPYAYFAAPNNIVVVPPDDSLTLNIQTAGTITVGAIPVQTFRAPPATQTTITKPTAPDGGPLAVPSTLPFEVTWIAPDAGAEQRLFVGFSGLLGLQKQAHIFCGYPLSAGKATIPSNFLAEVRSRLGATGSGVLHIWVGGQKEVVVGSDSFVIEVTRQKSTNLTASGAELPVQLQ